MDAGCYAVHMAHTFGGATPEVVSAQAKLRDPAVDRAMTAELKFPGGHTGGIRCSMRSSDLLNVSARVVGDRGELRVLNPVVPQLFHRLPPLACVSARRFRCRSAARASGQDDAQGRGREHERDPRDLSGRRAPIAQPELIWSPRAGPPPDRPMASVAYPPGLGRGALEETRQVGADIGKAGNDAGYRERQDAPVGEA